jgi:sugar phosphate isomerase/epimerase
MNRLGLEMLTLLGMVPVDHVRLAGELGCAEISTGLEPIPLSLFGVTDFAPYREWSLRDDPALRSEMKAAMRDTGVRIGLGEGFRVGPDCSPSAFAVDLDIMAELGAKCVNAVCMDDDLVASGAVKDGMAELAAMAGERGLIFTMEFFPPTGLNSIERVRDVIDHIGRGKARLLIDSMHFFRTGGTIESLKAIDPAMIGYVQLADSPAGPPGDDYMAMAMFERQVPGAGELPLRDFIAALPGEVTISVEVPRLDDLRAGLTPREHAARCIAAARDLGA